MADSTKNIVFLLTAHAADDERVWYHQKPSLERRGCRVRVVAPRTAFTAGPEMLIYHREGLGRGQTARHLASLLEGLHPDVVVGDTPLALHSALAHRRKTGLPCRILYDVTEWYPSKKNVRGLPAIGKAAKRALLALLNLRVSRRADGFIFGEKDKARPYRRLFPRHPFVLTSYYPDLEYIPHRPARVHDGELRLFYSGNLTEEKGFPRVLRTARKVAELKPHTRVILRVVSAQASDIAGPSGLPGNLSLEWLPFLPFRQFCLAAAECDLFLDLRDDDAENRRCLPIKLFYYMAMGRPVIYSDLDAIRSGCPEILSFGHLTRPDNVDAAAEAVLGYLQDNARYQLHCRTARELALRKYNWHEIEEDFVNFVLTT